MEYRLPSRRTLVAIAAAIVAVSLVLAVVSFVLWSSGGGGGAKPVIQVPSPAQR